MNDKVRSAEGKHVKPSAQAVGAGKPAARQSAGAGKSAAKKRTPMQRFMRWQRRLFKRYPWGRVALPAGAALLVLAIALPIVLHAASSKDAAVAPEAEIAALPVERADNPVERADLPAPTAAPTPVPSPTATPEPTIDGLPQSVYQQAAAPAAAYADPAQNNLLVARSDIASTGTGTQVHMGASSQYSTLEGVTTFRGNNYRDGGAYGAIPENPSHLSVMWTKGIGSLAGWSGVGWTGQASVVRWPAELRNAMNIVPAKRAKDGLIEAIYATLDGKIYFLDLEDGEPTRDPINVGAPIKGSVTVDPRGVPLLYCGQGIYQDVNGKNVDCGTRIWSLIDQKLLYFLNGKDSRALRSWYAFDCTPLVDSETDTMVTAGENGILYSVKLNTNYMGDYVSIDPAVTRYGYKQTLAGKLGTENSVTIYNNYVYFATNIGIIQCVDLNTMELVWSLNGKDDIDATLVIEPEADGTVALYGANEVDKRGSHGRSQMFKVNALTGELIWYHNSDKIYQHNDNGGGSSATPAVGKNDLSNLVFFHICRTEDSGAVLYALDKATGETVWSRNMGKYGWSSPTCVYTASGKGYVLIGSSNGMLRLLDGLTGQQVAEVELRGNIEGSPAVFGDMIVLGTRSNRIYGIRIS